MVSSAISPSEISPIRLITGTDIEGFGVESGGRDAAMRNGNSMHLPSFILTILIFVGAVRAGESDQPWHIQGEVVDELGTPVEDFQAATFWVSNGNWWDDSGELLEEAVAGKLWTNEGVPAPMPLRTATSQPEGRFTLTVDGPPRVSILAVDKRRERGGIVFVEQNAADDPVAITMVPLVRVTAEVYCSEAGRTPDWSNVWVFPVGDKATYHRLMICGSYRGEVSFLLPPGQYELHAVSTSPNARLPNPKGQQGIRV